MDTSKRATPPDGLKAGTCQPDSASGRDSLVWLQTPYQRNESDAFRLKFMP